MFISFSFNAHPWLDRLQQHFGDYRRQSSALRNSFCLFNFGCCNFVHSVRYGGLAICYLNVVCNGGNRRFRYRHDVRIYFWHYDSNRVLRRSIVDI